MGHKKESHDHDERRKCRRQSNSPSTKRARKNRSCSMSISAESKGYGKDSIINLCQNLYHILPQNLQNLCHDVHHHKQNMEVAVNEIMLVLNKQAIAEVKVILQLTKKRKISIRVSMKKMPKQIEE